VEIELALSRVVLIKEGDSFEIPFAVAHLISRKEGTDPVRLRLLVNDMGVVREFVGGPYSAEVLTEKGEEVRGEATFSSSQFVGGYVVVEFEFELGPGLAG